MRRVDNPCVRSADSMVPSVSQATCWTTRIVLDIFRFLPHITRSTKRYCKETQLFARLPLVSNTEFQLQKLFFHSRCFAQRLLSARTIGRDSSRLGIHAVLLDPTDCLVIQCNLIVGSNQYDRARASEVVDGFPQPVTRVWAQFDRH